MAVELKTDLGKIVFTEDLIASIAGYAAGENYGIAGMGSNKTAESIMEFIKKDNLKRGITVKTVGPGEVDIDLYVMLVYGVSLPAVATNARDNVRFRVQEYTGISVRNINIYVEGIRV